jgi:hypothetical protein
MKNSIQHKFSLLVLGSLVLFSCKKQTGDVLIPYPNDITFEEQTLDRFSFKVPDGPFQAGDAESGMVTVNVKKKTNGSYSGFALSNKNWRSYPWNLSPDFVNQSTLTAAQIQSSIDSTIFSVYTTRPNHTGTFLVGRVEGDDAAITLQKPSVVEHVLVANTTYNFLLETYGSVFSGSLNAQTQEYSLTGTKVRNVQNPNTSTAMYGRFTLPGPGGMNLIRLAGDEILAKRQAGKTAADAARLAGKTPSEVAADSTAAANALSKGYVKLTVTGMKGGAATGDVDYYLAIRPNVDPANPTLSYIAPDWFKVDLTSLGTVDQLVFHLSSSYQDTDGNMLVPPYFCLDGIRLRK